MKMFNGANPMRRKRPNDHVVAGNRNDVLPGQRNPSCWLLGHALFFAQIQGSILRVQFVIEAIDDGSEDVAILNLERLIQQLNGIGVVFKYTGGLHPDTYKSVIRPSMERRLPGVTGLWDQDHGVFVALSNDLRKKLPNLDKSHFSIVNRYKLAMSALWCAHAHVCSAAVGVAPSLNAELEGETDLSAPDSLIHHFRVRMLEGPAAAKASTDLAKAGKGKCPFGFKKFVPNVSSGGQHHD